MQPPRRVYRHINIWCQAAPRWPSVALWAVEHLHVFHCDGPRWNQELQIYCLQSASSRQTSCYVDMMFNRCHVFIYAIFCSIRTNCAKVFFSFSSDMPFKLCMGSEFICSNNYAAVPHTEKLPCIVLLHAFKTVSALCRQKHRSDMYRCDTERSQDLRLRCLPRYMDLCVEEL